MRKNRNASQAVGPSRARVAEGRSMNNRGRAGTARAGAHREVLRPYTPLPAGEHLWACGTSASALDTGAAASQEKMNSAHFRAKTPVSLNRQATLRSGQDWVAGKAEFKPTCRRRDTDIRTHVPLHPNNPNQPNRHLRKTGHEGSENLAFPSLCADG